MTLRFSRTCPIFFLFLIEKRTVILLFLHRRYTKDIVGASRTSRYVLLVKYDNNEFYSLSSINEQQTQRFILFRVNKNRRQTQRKFLRSIDTRENKNSSNGSKILFLRNERISAICIVLLATVCNPRFVMRSILVARDCMFDIGLPR